MAKPEHLNYLKRLEALEDVNFRQNPVKRSDPRKYYELIEANCPQLATLDDEDVSSGFFDRKKTETVPKVNVFRSEDDLIQRFSKLGVDIAAEPDFNQEPDDEALLVRTIKTQNRDQKAKQSYEQNCKFFQDDCDTITCSND